MQQPLQSSSTSVNLHLPIPLLLLNKIIFTIPTNTPFLYAAAIFTPLFLCLIIPVIYTENIFPTSPI